MKITLGPGVEPKPGDTLKNGMKVIEVWSARDFRIATIQFGRQIRQYPLWALVGIPVERGVAA